MKKKHWYDYLWIWSILYFFLGFFNILFAWLGMIDFLVPVLIAVIGGNKWFCNNLCGRGQLFTQIGGKWKCSRNKKGLSLWVSRIFSGDVRKHHFPNLSGRCRSIVSDRSDSALLDI